MRLHDDPSFFFPLISFLFPRLHLLDLVACIPFWWPDVALRDKVELGRAYSSGTHPSACLFVSPSSHIIDVPPRRYNVASRNWRQQKDAMQLCVSPFVVAVLAVALLLFNCRPPNRLSLWYHAQSIPLLYVQDGRMSNFPIDLEI